jgi:nitrite reductase/ring-hydroxylating ferredoxin subunit
VTKHVVARRDEIAPSTAKAVQAGGREIAVFNVNGAFFAMLNRCPHEGAPLALGRLTCLVQSSRPGKYDVSRKGEMLRCPWHGWEFDIGTGQSYCDPQRMRVRAFDVQIVSGETLAKGPYVAETFPTSIEEDYIVVEL